ncbi:hypothetical protein [Erythrobacter alti]|uniref:hypothetical protein n=1 Tax=Erythrobacter alti TaxID=1896145 RepID=UPI0030F42B23
MEHTQRVATPWHVWVIGLVSLLWNSGGAYDYVMTQTRNMDYLVSAAETAGVDPDVMVAYYTAFPAWANAFWALGVWGAFVGSLLLLIRSRYAFHAFLISILGIAGTTVFTATSDMPAELKTTWAWLFSAAIVIITILLAYYARKMTERGVLR